MYCVNILIVVIWCCYLVNWCYGRLLVHNSVKGAINKIKQWRWAILDCKYQLSGIGPKSC